MSTALSCRRLVAFSKYSPHLVPIHSLRPVSASRFQMYATSVENLPRVAQPSTWHLIIPKAIRNINISRPKPRRTKGWNPATFFVCAFLLIGSNAIQMLVLKNDYLTFSRKADARIRQLKDVLDRVQRGENVDIEKALGTGDEEQEQQWREVLQDIEEEGQAWQTKSRKRQEKQQQEQETEVEVGQEVADQEATDDMEHEKAKSTTKSVNPSDFY